jgi:sugar lactone lactonase YvrE
VEELLAGGRFFESPRWHAGRWWVSDFFGHVVMTIDERGNAEEVLRVDAQPSGLGWLPDGSLLVVSMRNRLVLRRSPDGDVAVHADLSDVCDWHTNDMVVGSDGRAYVGNFGFDLGSESPRATALVRVEPDGTSARVADGLLFPNGSVITPDGRTLIVAETWVSRLTAFTIGADGSLSDRRTWAVVPRSAPDGCTLDAEGCVWFADARRNRCLRIAGGGKVVDERSVSAGLRCFACMLGGPDGRTLAVCAAPDYEERARTALPESVLLTTRVDVPHAGLP